MLVDPFPITYSGAAKNLARIGTSENESIYRLDDSGTVYTVRVSHQFAKRNRAVVRITRDSAVTDPLIPANSMAVSMTATLTMDFPVSGLTTTDAQLLAKALVGWATDANLLKIANGET